MRVRKPRLGALPDGCVLKTVIRGKKESEKDEASHSGRSPGNIDWRKSSRLLQYSNSDRTWKSETGQIRLAGSPAKTRLFICRSFRSAEPSNSSPIAFSEHLSLA